MKQDLEIAINAWYDEWLQLHDPYNDDFEEELEKFLPHVQFTYDIHNGQYIVL